MGTAAFPSGYPMYPTVTQIANASPSTAAAAIPPVNQQVQNRVHHHHLLPAMTSDLTNTHTFAAMS